MPFTATLELTDTAAGGCTYRVIAVHQDRGGAEQHTAMGFHHGWATVLDQLAEHLHGA